MERGGRPRRSARSSTVSGSDRIRAVSRSAIHRNQSSHLPDGRRLGMRLRSVFRDLLDRHGPQHWWPADSPFEVMVGAILTQNTTWTQVERAVARLRSGRMLDPRAILSVSPAALGALIRPSGYFRVKAIRLRAMCAWFLREGGLSGLSKWPTDDLRQALLAVHGIGPETADDILLYAFRRPVFVIDAYTRRLFGRLGVVEGDEPYEALRSLLEAALGPDARLFGEYHALIVRHAREVCRKRPRCGECPLARDCAHYR